LGRDIHQTHSLPSTR